MIVSSMSTSTRCPIPENTIRHLALSRILYHHRPRPAGHSGRGQDPPRPRNHRTGPRRPEELHPGPPAIGEVQGQRGLASPGRHCVQPDSRRSERRRNITDQSDHSHHPPQTDHHPCPDRVLGQTAETAPTHRLALARLMDRAVHPDLRTTPNRDSLTTCRQRPNHGPQELSLIHISEPTRRTPISYAVFCLKN